MLHLSALKPEPRLIRSKKLLTYRPVDGVERSKHVAVCRRQDHTTRLSVLKFPPVEDRGSRWGLHEGYASERFVPVRHADFIRMESVRAGCPAIVVEICAASARTDTEGGGGSLEEDEMRTASSSTPALCQWALFDVDK